MFKRTPLSLAVAALLVLPAAAIAEIEVSGYAKNETAFHIQDGQRTGQAATALDTTTDDVGDVMKFENSVRLFVNGDVGEESSFHADLNMIYDSKGVNADYKGHRSFTQNDWIREIYLDTTAAAWDFRIGKQQEVWGTADGIKLLDIINPTDFRELNQNTMEDSRIPIFMVKGETDVGENGNFQFIVSQAEENKIPGLNSNGDTGHPFLMKGVDTITGPVNGFLNIAPAMGAVSNSFHNFATAGSFTGGGANAAGLVPFSSLSVDGFAAQNWNVTFAGALPLLAGTGTPALSSGSTANPLAGGPGTYSGNELLNTFANDTASVGANSNAYTTNLTNVTTPSTVVWSPASATSAFEYMPSATFTTFNTFAGNQGTGGTIAGLSTRYVRDYPDSFEPNAGFRFRNSTDTGLNYSVNYFYHYDSNPSVDLSYHDAVTGQKLTSQIRAAGGGGMPTGAVISRDSATLNAFSSASVVLTDGTNFYGAVNPMTGATGDATHAGNAVELRFTERLNRVNSLGTSFDYAFDTAAAPVVIRGEFLYDKDTKQPVVDKRLLAIGDLEGSLTMQDADMFKYVLGIDVSVMTNLMISGQFIQFRNLNYIDTDRSCTTQFGSTIDCSKYTADFATLHLTNGLNQAEKNKEFYSLFFSKPFGESQLGRWNNITIYEEGGGWWNRFDVEYSFSDQLVGTAELNTYWGDENTTFGQFQESSSIQLGVKYLFE